MKISWDTLFNNFPLFFLGGGDVKILISVLTIKLVSIKYEFLYPLFLQLSEIYQGFRPHLQVNQAVSNNLTVRLLEIYENL